MKTASAPVAAAFAAILMGSGAVARAESVFTLDPTAPGISHLARSPAVVWQTGAGRFAGPALCVSAPPEGGRTRLLLFETPRPLPGPGQYRGEAWVRADEGRCSVALILHDGKTGAERARYPIATDVNGVGWCYGACDLPLDLGDDSRAFNVEVVVAGGAARVSDLAVCMSDSMLVNGSFRDVDESAPTSMDVSPTRPVAGIPRGWRRFFFASDGEQAAGNYRVEPGPAGNDLVVTKSDGAFVLSAEPVPVGAEVVGFVARARVAEAKGPQPSVCLQQFGRRGAIAGAPPASSPPARGGVDAVDLSTGVVRRHPDAIRLLVWLRFPVEAGVWRIRSVGVHPLTRRAPNVRILADQVGYDLGDPVRFVVASDIFPAGGGGSFTLQTGGRTAYGGPLRALGRSIGQHGADWGSYYFEGIANGVGAGSFELKVSLNGPTASFGPIVVSPHRHLRETGEPAFRYYSIQRCGDMVPGWHGPCHLDDGRLPDGTHVDVAGGYHNAGDYGKWTGDNTPLSVYAMLAAYRSWKGYFDAMDGDGNGRADILDEAIWGADWLLKMVDPRTGRVWAGVDSGPDYFGIPEKETDGAAGTADDRPVITADEPDLAAFVVASWAALSRLGIGGRYLQAAERTWSAYEAEIPDRCNPRHVFAAIELYRATGNETYLRAADGLVGRILRLQTPEGAFVPRPGGRLQLRVVDEGTTPAALATYAMERRGLPEATNIDAVLRRYYEWSFRMADNPFGIIRNDEGKGPFYFMERRGLYVGNNSQYLSTAWAALLAARLLDQDPAWASRLRQHAARHIGWVLGCNPLGLCMFEGKGNSSRIVYHHRYADIPGRRRGAVPGTIPNGIIREPGNADRPWFDLRDVPFCSTYSSNESWLPHNAHYLLVLSALGEGASR